MARVYVTSILLAVSVLMTSLTYGRFIPDPSDRMIKRTSSDQRLAELQALIALSKGRDINIGHGQIDPWRIGRKKRDIGSFYESLSPELRLRILNSLLQDENENGFL